MKSAYNASADSWMLEYPSPRITQFGVVRIFGRAYNRVANIEKATNGLRHTGLWPYDSDMFTDEDFTAAELLMGPNEADKGDDLSADASPGPNLTKWRT